jgi:hypothetical protein
MITGLRNFLRKNKPFVDFLIPIALAYFAWSTDRVYHRLTEITEGQKQIMEIQYDPVFDARIELQRDEATDNFDADRILVENTGAPITVQRLNHREVFEVRYWSPSGSTLVYIPTVHYNTIGIRGHSMTGELYSTTFTKYRLKEFELERAVGERKFGGRQALINFRRFLEIGFVDRLRRARTEYLELQTDGSTILPESLGQKMINLSSAIYPAGIQLDFDTMGVEEFLGILEVAAKRDGTDTGERPEIQRSPTEPSAPPNPVRQTPTQR